MSMCVRYNRHTRPGPCRIARKGSCSVHVANLVSADLYDRYRGAVGNTTASGPVLFRGHGFHFNVPPAGTVVFFCDSASSATLAVSAVAAAVHAGVRTGSVM